MELKNLYKTFASTPEGVWIMNWANAQLLYKYITENSIKKVLDLGTGIGASAAVMALAFKDKGETDYHIDSVEQYDKCIRLANQLIPKELKTNITIYKASPVAWKNEMVPYQHFSVYDKLPEGEYDLIINDGPAPFVEKILLLSGEHESYIDLPNGTIQQLLIERKLKPGTKIIYDGRILSLNLLEKYYSDNFTLNFIPPRGGDFHVLERKDNEIDFKDGQYEAIKAQTPYFKNHEENTVPINESGTQSKTTVSPEGVK